MTAYLMSYQKELYFYVARASILILSFCSRATNNFFKFHFRSYPIPSLRLLAHFGRSKLLYPLLARMLVTLLHPPWWLRHLLQTEIVTSFFLLSWDLVLLGFEGLPFTLSSHSRLMSSSFSSLMVIVVSLSTPILCLASVIVLFV